MFCPKCRYEYVQGVTECPECGVPLVEELPPEPKQESVKLVTVFVTNDALVVAVAKSILDSAGIRYLVKGEMLRWAASGPMGELVEFQVAEADAENAKQLLKDLKESNSDHSY